MTDTNLLSVQTTPVSQVDLQLAVTTLDNQFYKFPVTKKIFATNVVFDSMN